MTTHWAAVLLCVGTAAAAPDAEDSRDAAIFGAPEAAKDAGAGERGASQKPDAMDANQGEASAPDAEDSRDAAIFGAPEAAEDAGAGERGASPADRAEASLFGDGPDAPQGSDALQGMLEQLDEQDPLSIGGFLFLRFNYAAQQEGEPGQFPLRSPNLFDIFFDARPTDRVRAYARGRLNYDFTVTPGSTNQFGQPQQAANVLLDQLWLKFDIARRVFITFGRQPLRWGVTRFWLPTDFLNRQRLDPIALFDERLGVDLLKVHVPVESLNWNLYAIAQLGEATNPTEIGGALRGEFLWGPAEVTLTAAKRRSQPWQLGAAVSAGVWELDVRAESSVVTGVQRPFYRGGYDPNELVSRTLEELTKPPEQRAYEPSENPFGYLAEYREDQWFTQTSLGAEYSWRYTSDDVATVGIEYFYNQLGYSDSDIYPVLLATGEFRPLYTGQHYAALYSVLAGLGASNESTLLASVLGNLSDTSFLARLDYRIRILRYLDVNAFVNYHFGRLGELNLGFELPPLPDTVPDDLAPEDAPQGANALLQDGLEVVPPLLEVGVGLQLRF